MGPPRLRLAGWRHRQADGPHALPRDGRPQVARRTSFSCRAQPACLSVKKEVYPLAGSPGNREPALSGVRRRPAAPPRRAAGRRRAPGCSRHFPWRNRATLSDARVMWPSTMAVQMPAGERRPVACEHAAQAERHDDLRDDRDDERAARVAAALQRARVGERHRDEQPRHAEEAQQLAAEIEHDRDRSGRTAGRACAAGRRTPAPSRWPGRARCARRSPGARSLRSGRLAPRFWPTTADVAPISPTDVHVTSENSSP